ncbi:MAG: hypothetical protein IJN80_05215 [Clostridia bacterium]|nr:hypothetical protein [Clostridia bacterium]
MEIKTLYRYEREGGGVTVSTERPDCTYTELFRIIADEGKAITLNGEDLRAVVDVDCVDGWYEVDAPTEDSAALLSGEVSEE